MPSVEQPTRVAEFDAFFADAVRSVDRVGVDRLRLVLDLNAGTAGRAAELMVRETACCSFFSFGLVVSGAGLVLEVAVPAGQAAVLDALSARAAAGLSS